MKKRKALDLQDLHETAAACHWANGFLTDPKGRIEAEKSHGEMESYMDRLKFHFGVWKSNKRPDLAIQTILIYAYEERHTYYFKYENRERRNTDGECLTYESLGKEHDAESFGEALDNFYEYFGTCKTNFELAEQKWSSSYGLTWALLVRYHFEVYDIIKLFSGLVKKFKKAKKSSPKQPSD